MRTSGAILARRVRESVPSFCRPFHRVRDRAMTRRVAVRAPTGFSIPSTVGRFVS